MQNQQTKAYIQQWGVRAVPVGTVIHGKLPVGEHPMFALLAWIERQPNRPVVGMQLTILSEDLDQVIGAFTLGLPLTPRSERHVCHFLERLGWDGRVWPYKDHGWPEGLEEEQGLIGLLKKAKLGATLTFPPQAAGTPVIKIPVLNRTKPFAVAPYPDETPAPRQLEALRALALDPKPFQSDW